MGTRTTIQIEGCECKIYNHWDSPNAIEPWLKGFHADFLEKRGCDESYELAQLLRNSVNQSNLDKSKYTGWGILSANDDCGEAYEFICKRDGTITLNGDEI